MTTRTHNNIASALNILVALGSFEGLIAILNQDQPVIFIKTAFYVGLFFILQIVLLYDLHYKRSGSLQRAKKKHENAVSKISKSFGVLGTALWDRCSHLREWDFIRKWANYLILPGIIFWSTISIFFVNFGFYKIQQIFVVLSTAALYLNYRYLKEIFSRGKEIVDKDIFVVLSVVKIYAGAVMYGASLALIRYYCLDSKLLFLGVFALTFLLLYQALFQHRLINIKNISISLLISVAMAVAAYLVLVFWGYNYFTAAVFLAALYNLMWGAFHYQLDKALSWKAFWEILIIALVVGAMVISVTNFKAQLLDSCQYTVSW